MDALRQHDIDFTLPLHLKGPVSVWTKNVRSYLTTISTTQPDSHDTLENLNNVPNMDNILESITVQNTIQLISKLGHHLPQVRTKSASFLFQLACLLEPKMPSADSRMEKVLGGLYTADIGTFVILTHCDRRV